MVCWQYGSIPWICSTSVRHLLLRWSLNFFNDGVEADSGGDDEGDEEDDGDDYSDDATGDDEDDDSGDDGSYGNDDI